MIKLICVGKLKESFYKEACAEFIKRMGRYCRFDMIEVADEKAPEKLSDAQKATVMRAEGERILARISDGDYVIATAIDGKRLSSTELADAVKALRVSGHGDIAYVIGGTLGLSAEVYARADMRLSFSPMTFSHQVFRVMLLEQIYRAEKIIAGETYHK